MKHLPPPIGSSIQGTHWPVWAKQKVAKLKAEFQTQRRPELIDQEHKGSEEDLAKPNGNRVRHELDRCFIPCQIGFKSLGAAPRMSQGLTRSKLTGMIEA